MSIGGITFSGLSSGLDTRAIIDALLDVERRPIRALEIDRTGFDRQKSLFGQFGQLLEDLETAARKLAGSDFVAFGATTDRSDFLTATAGSGALAGNYTIEVGALAAAEVRASDALPDKDVTTYSGGALEFTIDGAVQSVTIENDSTLEEIAAQVNAAGIEVQAQVVDLGTGSNRYQLVFTSKVSGSNGSFTVGGPDGLSLDALAQQFNSNAPVVDASDASLTVNGISLTRTSNTVTDAIPGVTLQLVQADPTQSTTVSVQPDAAATADDVQGFLDAYNAVVDFVEGQSQTGPDGATSTNPLFGDSTLRTIRSNLRSIVGDQAATGNPAFSLLSQVGIDADTEGRLSLDRAAFEDALATDRSAVETLFADSAVGFATRITDRVASFTDSTDGLIAARQDALDDLIARTADRIERQERRLESLEEQLVERFAALEQLLTQLNGQGNALSAIGGGTSPTPTSFS